MSGSLGLSPLEAAELAATKIQLGRYVVISLYVVQLCEWVALWDDEWRLIHCTRWTSMKVVYLCCRYYPLISWIFYIWALVGDHELEICQRVLKPLYLLMIPYQLTAQAVMVTRAWAFTGRQTAVLVLLLSAYAVLLGMEIWVFGTNVEIGPSSLRDVGLNTGCVRDSSIGKPSSPHRLGILFMSAFTLDFLCIVIMTVHCIRLRSLQGPLGKTFLQQGFRAFFLMSALHIAAATCALSRFGSTLIVSFPLILSNIVACRLTLSLRKRASLGTETQQLRELSRVVRNAAHLSSYSEPDDWAN